MPSESVRVDMTAREPSMTSTVAPEMGIPPSLTRPVTRCVPGVSTSTVRLARLALFSAATTASPFLPPVASPVAEMLSTLSSEVRQVVVAVRSCVVLSDIWPIAAYCALVPGGTDAGPSTRMLCSVGWFGWFGGGGGGIRDAWVGDLSQAASHPPTSTVETRAIVRNRDMTELLLLSGLVSAFTRSKVLGVPWHFSGIFMG